MHLKGNCKMMILWRKWCADVSNILKRVWFIYMKKNFLRNDSVIRLFQIQECTARRWSGYLGVHSLIQREGSLSFSPQAATQSTLVHSSTSCWLRTLTTVPSRTIRAQRSRRRRRRRRRDQFVTSVVALSLSPVELNHKALCTLEHWHCSVGMQDVVRINTWLAWKRTNFVVANGSIFRHNIF